MSRQLMTVSCSQPIFDIRKEQAFVKIERETKVLTCCKVWFSRATQGEAQERFDPTKGFNYENATKFM